MDRYDMEEVLRQQGSWDEGDDRGVHRGTFFHINYLQCTLTIWWTTKSYRTKLGRGVHPSGEDVQMFGA